MAHETRPRSRKTVLGMPEAVYNDLTRRPCAGCGSPAPQGGNHPQRDRTVLCSPCVNGIIADIGAQRAAARKSAPRCEGCGTRRGTRHLLCTDRRVLVCGTCNTKVNRQIRRPALFGAPQVTAAEILTVLQPSA